jgi:hypothetical protein
LKILLNIKFFVALMENIPFENVDDLKFYQ